MSYYSLECCVADVRHDNSLLRNNVGACPTSDDNYFLRFGIICSYWF